MTEKEKIRAYVKRLQKPEGYGDYWKGYDSALNDILSFIDSLQEEPVDKCIHFDLCESEFSFSSVKPNDPVCEDYEEENED